MNVGRKEDFKFRLRYFLIFVKFVKRQLKSETYKYNK